MNLKPPGVPSMPSDNSRTEQHAQRLAAVLDLARLRGREGITIPELERIYEVHPKTAKAWVHTLARWGHLAVAGKRAPTKGRPANFYVLVPKRLQCSRSPP
jgi:hypothetical protein